MSGMRIGILGYGNLGKAVEKAVSKQSDMELTGIFSRRSINHMLAKPVDALMCDQDIDVLILCSGSAVDLPLQTPKYAKRYHVVDSFDHHQEIAKHFRRVDEAARAGEKLALISCGWDPGLFSMIRVMMKIFLGEPDVYTFWGKGISQGHSDAIRRIEGVRDARQYTIPLEPAIQAAREGRLASQNPTQMHRRECYVTVEEGVDLKRIEQSIKDIPDYFSEYDTIVHFVSPGELEKEHSGFPHGGTVIGRDDKAQASFVLKIDSNPDFTAGILTAYARAVYKMGKNGETGCRTVMDIPLSILQEKCFVDL